MRSSLAFLSWLQQKMRINKPQLATVLTVCTESGRVHSWDPGFHQKRVRDSGIDCSREAGFTKIDHRMWDNDKKVGCRICIKKEWECGIRTPPPLPDPVQIYVQYILFKLLKEDIRNSSGTIAFKRRI